MEQTGSSHASLGRTADRPNPDAYRVMVVEDSIVIRGLINRVLESDADIKIAASVGDGEEAIKALKQNPIDVVVLDIEMPVMDGMTAIPHLLAIDPHVKIIMASTLTQRNAEISIKALELGAADYIPKPSSSRELTAAADFKRELVDKVKALAKHARRSGVRTEAGPKPMLFRAAQTQAAPKTAFKAQGQAAPAHETLIKPIEKAGDRAAALRPWPALMRPEILAIGSSTGGPQALFVVIKQMGANLSQPVVITQHMPASFTTILADHISKQCGVNCQEAKEGDELLPGHYYLAPGDFHMIISSAAGKKRILLNQEPPENFCRPAVDPMLRSLVQVYGKNILATILTGMGSDGAKGCEKVAQAGGAVIAQDEATSVVWGMPGAAANSGVCSAILPLSQIGETIKKIASGIRP